METDLVVHLLMEEARARKRCYFHLFGQPLAEAGVIRAIELADIDKHIVGPLWFGVLQFCLVQIGKEQIPFPGIQFPQFLIIRQGKPKTGNCSLFA